jgi:hypothetical protein
MAIVAWRSAAPTVRWRLFLHALDLVLFSAFVYLTEGPASPFFLYFIFSLFCATLRFSWRGILATGIAATAIYGAMAIVASLRDPSFDVGRVLIRETYLGVIAAFLVYFGATTSHSRTSPAGSCWRRSSSISSCSRSVTRRARKSGCGSRVSCTTASSSPSAASDCACRRWRRSSRKIRSRPSGSPRCSA